MSHTKTPTKTSILTYSGKVVDYLCPDPKQIGIKDIAIALSRETRFGGHTQVPYFVAQHCLFVSGLLSEEFALEGLLHDATEAYCRDIPTPLKNLLPDYHEIEARMDRVIRAKFGLPLEMSPEVKAGDFAALQHEMHSFTKHKVSATYAHLIPLSSEQAYTAFLARFKELYSA